MPLTEIIQLIFILFLAAESWVIQEFYEHACILLSPEAAQITMEKSELSLITASSTVDLLASSADWKEASETASFQTAHLRLETAKLIGQVGGVLENQKKLCKELRWAWFHGAKFKQLVTSPTTKVYRLFWREKCLQDFDDMVTDGDLLLSLSSHLQRAASEQSKGTLSLSRCTMPAPIAPCRIWVIDIWQLVEENSGSTRSPGPSATHRFWARLQRLQEVAISQTESSLPESKSNPESKRGSNYGVCAVHIVLVCMCVCDRGCLFVCAIKPIETNDRRDSWKH